MAVRSVGRESMRLSFLKVNEHQEATRTPAARAISSDRRASIAPGAGSASLPDWTARDSAWRKQRCRWLL